MSFFCHILKFGTATLALLAATQMGLAENPNTDFITPAFTRSPGGAYAVKVPVFHMEGVKESDRRSNEVVDAVTGKTIAVIHGKPGYDRALNHHELLPPRWSTDGSLLLWKVEGKWFFDNLVLLKLADGKEKWQLDLMKLSQQAILKRTKKADPKGYAAAKADNAGNGSAYPGGFTVYVVAEGEDKDPVALPLVIRVDLTSDPKAGDLSPAKLQSHLDAVVSADGKFTVTGFGMGKRK